MYVSTKIYIYSIDQKALARQDVERAYERMGCVNCIQVCAGSRFRTSDSPRPFRTDKDMTIRRVLECVLSERSVGEEREVIQVNSVA